MTKSQRKNWEQVAKCIELEGRLKPGQAFDVLNELCRVMASTVGPCVISAMLEHGLQQFREKDRERSRKKRT